MTSASGHQDTLTFASSKGERNMVNKLVSNHTPNPTWWDRFCIECLNKFMPEKMKRLFYITTLFTMIVQGCGREVKYNRLFTLLLDLTPTSDTFNLPALFTDHIWGDSEIARKICEGYVLKNEVQIGEIESATPYWLHYYKDTNIMYQDTLMVYQTVLMELRDPKVKQVDVEQYRNLAKGG